MSSGFERLGQSLSSEQDRWLDRAGLAAEVRASVLAFDGAAVRRRARRIRVGAGFLGVAAAACAGILLWQHETAPLRVTLGESKQAVATGTWVSAPEHQQVGLNFSDGTHVQLKPEARARVTAVSREGAHLILENGAVALDVVPRKRSAWMVQAGPFSVQVTGTRFELSWQPERDAFELRLKEGSVLLTGCSFGEEGTHLSAGQTARASCARKSVEIFSGKIQPNTEASGAMLDTLPSAPLPEPGDVTNDTKLRASREPEWRLLLRRGQYEKAYARAVALGFTAVCARSTAPELIMLGDAARFATNVGHALAAYDDVRRRFAGTESAALAALSIGRMYFDQRRDYAQAATWFRTYLTEAPEGNLAREARGRLMEALSRSKANEQARRVAEEYLRLYPKGPHAELAVSLLTNRVP